MEPRKVWWMNLWIRILLILLHFLAAINVSRLIVKSFIKHSIRGAIVNVSSQASKIGLRKQSIYCASKAGLDGYTRAAALELASLGIRINCVNPTVLNTELKGTIWSDSRMSEALLSRIPLKKFCDLQEVTDAVVFLLSDNASFITGIGLSLDGGISSSWNSEIIFDKNSTPWEYQNISCEISVNFFLRLNKSMIFTEPMHLIFQISKCMYSMINSSP